MFHKVLVANRGAVAARVIRALKALNVQAVAVYSEADAAAPYLQEADEAHLIGPGPAKESYLDQDKLIAVMLAAKCDAVHPGYGFLSENSNFALRVEGEGATFIGPSPKFIEEMGHKARARDLMMRYGMPISPGSEILEDDEVAKREAERIGYPVLIKPAGGGGGIGMLPARDEAELVKGLESARSMASRSFGTAEVYIEKLLERPRHVELQILGDRHGGCRHVFERDCSLQRRNQKIIEESPAPGIGRDDIEKLAGTTAEAMARIGYDNIGTVEMLRGADGGFHFLEVNTRLQVEHGVTEEACSVDLVAAQVRVAAGEKVADVLPDEISVKGHAIECRVYAEDPKRFFPSPGKLEVFRIPSGEGVRVETGFAEGMQVTPFYDPMVAKVITRGKDRDEAIARMAGALEGFEISGIKNNIPFLLTALRDEAFVAGDVHTGLVPEIQARAKAREK
ncbi:MAG: biotin carboxylase N-terminal domain-containing protein [Acetobacterales bacterium]